VTRAGAIAAAFALALACGAPARAGELDHDEEIEQIEALESVRRPSPAEQEELRALCADFLARFPGDEQADPVRQRLGATLCALGDDAAGARELAAVTATAFAKAGSKFRTFTWLELAQARVRLGDVEAARAALAGLLAEVPAEDDAAKAARQMSKDLAKIGKPAPGAVMPAEAAAPTPTAAFVLAYVRKGDARPKDLPANARVHEVASWDDPDVKRFVVPALPWFYVIDRDLVLRAAGVRGPAVARALEGANAGR
jgi:hypothetical protein